MGLDQYATTKRNNKTINTDFAYWRKHNALQGWMENLWEKKGRPNQHEDDASFNCVELELEQIDLLNLLKDVTFGGLPETSGFFFGGDSRFDEHYKEKTLDFIERALKEIENGNQVFYSSWW